jgi:hypothetical protein
MPRRVDGLQFIWCWSFVVTVPEGQFDTILDNGVDASEWADGTCEVSAIPAVSTNRGTLVAISGPAKYVSMMTTLVQSDADASDSLAFLAVTLQ